MARFSKKLLGDLELMTIDFVSPAGDPQIGDLATPINSSGFSKALINNLPAYRPGLSAQRRGLEIGMAHGYLLFGPFAMGSHFRNSVHAELVGVIAAVSLVVILTLCLSAYSSISVGKPIAGVTVATPPEALGTQEGWSEFSSGFLIGGIGGAIFAYGLYEFIQAGLLQSLLS